ncbi:hypothetical protein BDM02DRAFT_3190853 [Thelephora ganbajun]|uniref:Uncharacterized protein n=1 Tax=Thelephora ganbajun TaxID=370292 RepID=A0ACB6Z458_THEGA|nr:hypothetical protein BDM02DRAFT_3190853 [Thelephora ganbajun]
MTPSSAIINAIFNCPRDAAAILFLIEDSSHMAPLWQCLKDSYLPSLLAAVRGANPSAPAEVLWMTASKQIPFKPTFGPSTHRTPHWYDIPAVNFSPHSESTISPANVTCAIEALSTTFSHRRARRHLVIIAALNPSTDVLGPRGTLAWSTPVERLHQEEIRVHLIVRSQFIGKGRSYQSFTDDTQFAFYLSDFDGAIDKRKASAVDDRRVPNSGLQSISNDSSVSSIGKTSLVHHLRKLNGMEKKRRSRTRRGQPAPSKPGQLYQKSYFQTLISSSADQSTSVDPFGHSQSKRKGTSRASRVEASSPYPPLPRTSSDEYKSPYPSITSPSQSSSPSSHCPSAGTFSSPGSKNLSRLRTSLPTPTPTFDQFQHMALITQSTLDSPSSPLFGTYCELQSYSHELPRDLRLQHPVSQDESRLAATQFDDIYGPNYPRWNEYDRQQRRIEPSVYPRSLTSYPLILDNLVPRSTHRLEQTTTISSLPPISHGLDTTTAENSSGSYFHSGYKDRTAGTPLQNIYLRSDADSSTTVQYYS